MEALNKSTFYGEPAQLCDAGSSKIKGLPQLILVQSFLFLFNQHFPDAIGKELVVFWNAAPHDDLHNFPAQNPIRSAK